MRANKPIQKYLELLSLQQEPPSLSSLRKLQRRHIETVPHENINAIYNFPTDFNLDHLLHKYTVERRGGMCFELNYSFCELLKGLGYSARIVLCNVYAYEHFKENNAFPTHPVIVVDFDDKSYISDVGWCDSYREPLCLAGECYEDESGKYRIFQKNDLEFVMQKWLPENKDSTENYQWHDQFGFLNKKENVIEKSYPKGFLSAHAYTHVAPTYLFSKTLKFTRVNKDGHLSLWDDTVLGRKGSKKTRMELDVSRADFLQNNLLLSRSVSSQCKKLKRSVSMTFFEERNSGSEGCINQQSDPNSFKLDNYLRKVKVEKRLVESLTALEQLSYLNEIYLAHIKTIPFQNFELLEIGRQHPVARKSLQLDLFQKIFIVQTGGFCFQTAQLLYAALKSLGFDVQRSLAKVLAGMQVDSREALDLPETHLVLLVRINHQSYLLDPSQASHGKRSAFLITETGNAVDDGHHQFRLSQHSVNPDIFVFETLRNDQWFRIIQSRLTPTTDQKIQEKLCQLERFPKFLRVRDLLIFVYIATDNGFKILSWDQQQQRLIFSEESNGVIHKRALESFSEGYELLCTEFNITHVSADMLKIYCSNLQIPAPKRSWSVDFPLDEKELNQLSKNISI